MSFGRAAELDGFVWSQVREAINAVRHSASSSGSSTLMDSLPAAVEALAPEDL